MDPPLPRKICVTCRLPNISPYQNYKNCFDCREKNRQKAIRAAERKQARILAQSEWALSAKQSNLPGSDSDADLVMDPRTPTGATKPKTPLAAHDFNAHIAAKRAKGVVVKGEPREKDVVPTLFSVTSTAYQLASSMHSDLRSDQYKRNFEGHYSIVALPDIDNAKRVELVRKELRRVVNLPFDHKNAVKLRDPGYSLRFRCTCLGELAGIPRKCGGNVVVTSRTDQSHRLLIGQTISVSVTH